MFSNWGAFLFYAVSGFFVSPFVVNTLGNDVYGTWVLLSSMIGYLGLLDLGVRAAVTRFVSNLHAAGKHREAERFASAGLVFFSLAALVAVVTGAVFALVIGKFSIPAELVQPARLAIMLSALTIAAILLNGVYGGIITAMQRFDVSSGTDVAIEAVRIVGLILALRAGHGLVALAALQLGAALARLVISILWSRRLYPELRPAVSLGFRLSDIRQIFSFSVAASALHGAAAIAYQMDAIVIAWFLPVGQVTFFAIAGNLTNYAKSVVSAISTTVSPRVSALEGAGAHDEVKRVPLVAGRLASLVLLPIIVTFVVRGEAFIGLWMGPEYAVVSGRILRIFCLALLPSAARRVIDSAMMGLNRHRLLLFPYFSEAALNLILSLILVRSMGIEGVAWGTAIPAVLVGFGVLPPLYSRLLGTSWRTYWHQVWVRPAVAMLPFVLTTWLIHARLEPSSLLIFFGQVALALPTALAGAWMWGLDDSERRLLLGRLRRRAR